MKFSCALASGVRALRRPALGAPVGTGLPPAGRVGRALARLKPGPGFPDRLKPALAPGDLFRNVLRVRASVLRGVDFTGPRQQRRDLGLQPRFLFPTRKADVLAALNRAWAGPIHVLPHPQFVYYKTLFHVFEGMACKWSSGIAHVQRQQHGRVVVVFPETGCISSISLLSPGHSTTRRARLESPNRPAGQKNSPLSEIFCGAGS